MQFGIARIKGLGFVLWHSRHTFYHVLLGLVWAWYLRERWNEFNPKWIWFSVVGSLLPDLDHLLYFLSYGRHDWYTQQIRIFLRTHQWRNLTLFVANGHKYNTNLSSHNYFVMVFLFGSALLSSLYDWQTGVVLFGAMLIHYLFDVFDDIVILGNVNPNWRRWGRPKEYRRSFRSTRSSRQ